MRVIQADWPIFTARLGKSHMDGGGGSGKKRDSVRRHLEKRRAEKRKLYSLLLVVQVGRKGR